MKAAGQEISNQYPQRGSVKDWSMKPSATTWLARNCGRPFFATPHRRL